MITQQRSYTICNTKLIAIFLHLEKILTVNQIARMGNSIIHWIRETVQIDVIIVRPNFHVNISEQFTICECIRPSLEGSVNISINMYL